MYLGSIEHYNLEITIEGYALLVGGIGSSVWERFNFLSGFPSIRLVSKMIPSIDEVSSVDSSISMDISEVLRLDIVHIDSCSDLLL